MHTFLEAQKTLNQFGKRTEANTLLALSAKKKLIIQLRDKIDKI